MEDKEEFKEEVFDGEDYGKPEEFPEDIVEDFPDNEGDEFESEFEDAEELFRENPLKAIWIKLKNIEEKLDDLLDEEEGEQ